MPPLVPDEAVDFFTARARAIRPDFTSDDTVPLICRRLDDLPLALELAPRASRPSHPPRSSRVSSNALPLLTGGARDAPERQRTLRATIDWSHDLLTTTSSASTPASPSSAAAAPSRPRSRSPTPT